MSLFEVNPNIAHAETLVSDFYTDEKYFHESKEKIFARSWQLVGTTDEIDNLKPLVILEDFLDEPVVITKDGAKLDCISNVCTHRGKILVEKPCRMSGIRCGYHGRRFTLDGKFLSMPEFEGAADFPREKDNLPKIPFGIWKKFLFASVNPFAPLADFMTEVDTVLKGFNFENLRFVAAKDYPVKAHWALYCENYLEGFHVPFVHESLNQAIDYGSYTTETFRFSSLQTAQARLPGNAPVSREQAFDFDKKTAAFYFFVFPNLMLNFYPWGLSINVVKPLKPDLTKVSYLTFVSDESKLNTGAGANLETVELEDQAVVESVQRGIRSRFYSTGRYSPAKERGTHHFHRLIAEFMN